MKARAVLLLGMLLATGMVPAAFTFTPPLLERFGPDTPGDPDAPGDGPDAAPGGSATGAARPARPGAVNAASGAPGSAPRSMPLLVDAALATTPVDVLERFLAGAGLADDATPYPPMTLADAAPLHPLWEAGPIPPLPLQVDQTLGRLVYGHAQLTSAALDVADGVPGGHDRLVRAGLRFAATVEASREVLKTLPGVLALREQIVPAETTTPSVTLPDAIAHLYSALGAPTRASDLDLSPSGFTPEGDALLARAIEAAARATDAHAAYLAAILGPDGARTFQKAFTALHALSVPIDEHEPPIDGELVNEALVQVAGLVHEQQGILLGALVELQRRLQDLTGLPLEIVQVSEAGDVGVVFRDPFGLVWVLGPHDDLVEPDTGFCVPAGAATGVVGGAVAPFTGGSPPPGCIPVRGPGQAALLIDTGGNDTYHVPVAASDPIFSQFGDFQVIQPIPPAIVSALQGAGVGDDKGRVDVDGRVSPPGGLVNICISKNEIEFFTLVFGTVFSPFNLLFGGGQDGPDGGLPSVSISGPGGDEEEVCRIEEETRTVASSIQYNAVLPVSFAVDIKGDDTYANKTIAYAGPGAVTLLMDLEGNDSYTAHNGTGSATGLAVSMFADLAGDDSYTIEQGVGTLTGDFRVAGRYIGDADVQQEFGENGEVPLGVIPYVLLVIPLIQSGGPALFLDANGTDTYDLGDLAGGVLDASFSFTCGITIFIVVAFNACAANNLMVDLGGHDPGLLTGVPPSLHVREPHLGRVRLWTEPHTGPAMPTSAFVSRYRTALDTENATHDFQDEDGYTVGPFFTAFRNAPSVSLAGLNLPLGTVRVSMPPVLSVADAADTIHARSGMLMIDAGGNDHYDGVPGVNIGPNCASARAMSVLSTGQGCSSAQAGTEAARRREPDAGNEWAIPRVVIDVAGNDTYKANKNGLASAGFHDIRSFYDDTLIGNRTLFAALFDLDGDDVYDATDGPIGSVVEPIGHIPTTGGQSIVLDYGGRDTHFGHNMSFGSAMMAPMRNVFGDLGGYAVSAFVGVDDEFSPETFTAHNRSFGFAMGADAYALFAHVAPGAPPNVAGALGSAPAVPPGDRFRLHGTGLGTVLSGHTDGFGPDPKRLDGRQDSYAGVGGFTGIVGIRETTAGPLALAIGSSADDEYVVGERTTLGWFGQRQDEDARFYNEAGCGLQGGDLTTNLLGVTLFALRAAVQTAGPTALFLELDGDDSYTLLNLSVPHERTLDWGNDRMWHKQECEGLGAIETRQAGPNVDPVDGLATGDPTTRRYALGMDHVRTMAQHVALSLVLPQLDVLGGVRGDVEVRLCKLQRECGLTSTQQGPLAYDLGAASERVLVHARGIATASTAPSDLPEACDEGSCLAVLRLTYRTPDSVVNGTLVPGRDVEIDRDFVGAIRPCTTRLTDVCLWEASIPVPLTFWDDRNRTYPAYVALPVGDYVGTLALTDAISYETGTLKPVASRAVHVRYDGFPASVQTVRGVPGPGGASVVFDVPAPLDGSAGLVPCFATGRDPWRLRSSLSVFDEHALVYRTRAFFDPDGDAAGPDDDGITIGTAWAAPDCRSGLLAGVRITGIRTGVDPEGPTLQIPAYVNISMAETTRVGSADRWKVGVRFPVSDPLVPGFSRGNELFVETPNGPPELTLVFTDGQILRCGDDGIECAFGARPSLFGPADAKTIYLNATAIHQSTGERGLELVIVRNGFVVSDGSLNRMEACLDTCRLPVDVDAPRSRLRFIEDAPSGFVAAGNRTVPLEWRFDGVGGADIDHVRLEAREQGSDAASWRVVDLVQSPGAETRLEWRPSSARDVRQGLFLLRAMAVDHAGNLEIKAKGAADLILAFDVEEPTLLSAAQTGASKTTATVTATYSEAVRAVARMNGSDQVVRHADPARSHTFTWSALPAGTVGEATITAIDLAGNVLETVVADVRTSPSIQVGLLAPLPGDTLSGRAGLVWLSASEPIQTGGDPSMEARFRLVRGTESCADASSSYTETTGTLLSPSRRTMALDTAGCTDGAWVLEALFANSEQSIRFDIPLAVDNTPPTSLLQLLGAEGRAGWFRGPVAATATPVDDGEASTTVSSPSLRGNRTAPGATGLTFTTDGVHTMHVTTVDSAGHVVRDVHHVKIDATPPVAFVSLRAAGAGVVGALNAVDAASGPAFFRVTVSDAGPGSWIPLRAGETSFTFDMPAGGAAGALSVEVQDVAGNTAIASTPLDDPTRPPAVMGPVQIVQMRPSTATLAYRTEEPTPTLLMVRQGARLWAVSSDKSTTLHRVEVTGLAPATAAQVTVLTEGPAGARVEAAQITVTTPRDTSPPGAVTDASAVRRPDGSVTLTWGAPPDDGAIKHYVVARTAAEATTHHVTASTAYVDTDTLPGLPVAYSVTAVDMAGNQGPPGPAVTVVPRTAPRIVAFDVTPRAGTPETVFRFEARVADDDGDIPSVRLELGDDVLPMVIDRREADGLVFVAAARLPVGLLAQPVASLLVRATDGAFNATYPPSGIPARAPLVTIETGSPAATPSPALPFLVVAAVAAALMRRRRPGA